MHDAEEAFALTAPAIFDGDRRLAQHCVVVRGEAVLDVLPLEQLPADTPLQRFDTGTLAPGFVDLQVNGGGGRLFNNDPSPDTLRTMLAAHRALGTTALVPTVISDSQATRSAAMAAVKQSREEGISGVLGIHFEGPWLNHERHGAHREAALCAPDPEEIAWLCAQEDVLRLVTLAPECVPPGVIAQLSDASVIVCAGHTEATHTDMADAVTEGMVGVTHLFNAMRAMSAREPGVVGTALEMDALWAGIIADGHHVHPGAIRIAARAKPPGGLLLVSDAMATVGSSERAFTLYDETIQQTDGKLVNAGGRLAGSAIGLIDAVRYCKTEVGLPLEECLRMASLYPATAISLQDSMGRLSAGYRADIVHLNEEIRATQAWVGGEVIVQS